MANTHICATCGKEFRVKYAYNKNMYCSRSCVGRGTFLRLGSVRSRMSEAEKLLFDKAAREKLELTRRTTQYQTSLKEYLRSDRNPFYDPATRQKAVETRRSSGYPELNGGNGRPAPLPQKILATALGWPMEVAIGVNPARAGYPKNYKIDVAEPQLKIAIEVDGAGHRSPRARIIDQKKDDFLRSVGWIVLRFRNEEIMSDLDGVIKKVTDVRYSI